MGHWISFFQYLEMVFLLYELKKKKTKNPHTLNEQYLNIKKLGEEANV